MAEQEENESEKEEKEKTPKKTKAKKQEKKPKQKRIIKPKHKYGTLIENIFIYTLLKYWKRSIILIEIYNMYQKIHAYELKLIFTYSSATERPSGRSNGRSRGS